MKILVVTGGISSERKISLISAKAVKKALEENNHRVKLYDLKKGYTSLKKISQKFDVIFPVLHGEEGEGGKLHKFLSTLGKPFIGGDWKSFQKGWYKISFKNFCDQNNILTPEWKQLSLTRHSESILDFGFPSVLKASSGGSSREVVILKSKQDLKKNEYKKLLNSNLDLLVERFIPGVEVTVGIIGDQALPVLEIIPPAGGWFDYKNKYSGTTKEIPFAPSVKKEIQTRLQQIALKIHRLLNLGHYCRVDFIVSADGKPYVLEINTIPGLTPESLLPKAAEAAGISFPEFVEKLINMA